MIANLLGDLIIFGVTIKLMTILYIFIGAAGLALIIYFLNLLFRKNKFKKESEKNPNFEKIKNTEALKLNVDNEIGSIVKARKGKEK